MKADDFRSLPVEELDHRISEMKKELFNFRMQLHTNQLSNTNKLRNARKDIARALTVRQELAAQAEDRS